MDSLINDFKSTNTPLILSLNVRSLNNKFNEINSLISELLSKNINIMALAMQEIWQIHHPDLLKIKGFTLYTAERKFGRGGGVGFYIRNGLSAKIIMELSPFLDKEFESLTIEVLANKKKIHAYIHIQNPN